MWTREPAEVPRDFLHRIPIINSPFSTMTCQWVKRKFVLQYSFKFKFRKRRILYLGVTRRDVFVGAAVFVIRVCAVCADHVNVSRNDEAEDLLAGPQRTGLEDCRLRHFPVPRRQEHQEVHHFTLDG